MAARSGSPMTAKPEALASSAEVAEFLRDFPAKTLAEWRSRGIGPKYLKIGRHVRYRWSDVLDWLASREAKNGAA
jgi:predicted DNA-binding transcriptional regulator AlpA